MRYFLAVRPAPAMMASANIAAGGLYMDKDGQALDPINLDRFLTHFGEDLDPNELIKSTRCKAIAETRDEIVLGQGTPLVFNGEVAEAISSYECISGLAI
ncbi:hypothetical protein ACEPPN_000377 [Leptodophora sp. 'Broadleaf-Isolate-01']